MSWAEIYFTRSRVNHFLHREARVTWTHTRATLSLSLSLSLSPYTIKDNEWMRVVLYVKYIDTGQTKEGGNERREWMKSTGKASSGGWMSEWGRERSPKTTGRAVRKKISIKFLMPARTWGCAWNHLKLFGRSQGYSVSGQVTRVGGRKFRHPGSEIKILESTQIYSLAQVIT